MESLYLFKRIAKLSARLLAILKSANEKLDKRPSRESGMTLIEVLAVLLLTALVMMLIWTTVLTSMKYNITETKKLKMQQEANYIITDLQHIHRKCDTYRLEERDGEIWMTDCTGVDAQSDKKIGSENNFKIIGLPTKQEIRAKTTEASMNVNLVVADPVKNKLKVSVSTVISRYKVEKEE
ncbi:prepilin-type N-terminal cleavage/methylation domain-containing protein [Sporosarcina koreensis]|uniref:prepilin-type N-terminal cleavage/methylation domain-containing protein n=1 Tax=Sporosarcina koreensis TaxID=334735 RepID=UPI0009EC68F0|nr:prepilin-type N-terminal cleavage/methylation domain-containing protein [Sporosarcina koreensis]